MKKIVLILVLVSGPAFAGDKCWWFDDVCKFKENIIP